MGRRRGGEKRGRKGGREDRKKDGREGAREEGREDEEVLLRIQKKEIFVCPLKASALCG